MISRCSSPVRSAPQPHVCDDHLPLRIAVRLRRAEIVALAAGLRPKLCTGAMGRGTEKAAVR